jgi:DNA repair protein RadC
MDYETPSSRMEKLGVHALSDAELLALLTNVDLIAAQRLIIQAGSLKALSTWSEASLTEHFSTRTAQKLQSSMEIGRRIVLGDTVELPILNQANLIANFMASKVLGMEVEKFWVLSLNRKNRLLKCQEISSGTAVSCLAHPREIFRAAISGGATAIVCVHNHPSGDPSPSAADIQLTRQLREAAAVVDIPLLDHVIIGRRGADPLGRGYYSFREAGLL